VCIKEIAEIGSHIASIVAIAAAGWWFIYTTQFKPRIQFDVDCKFVSLQNSEQLIAEIQFIFENKGFVEHRLWNLNVSVDALKSGRNLKIKEGTHELIFDEKVMSKVQLVPKEYEYYFVRPGVKQVITHTIEVSSSISAIRITASFDYNRNKDYPHTARRVFGVPGNVTDPT
jgi:hypothetical protein